LDYITGVGVKKSDYFTGAGGKKSDFIHFWKILQKPGGKMLPEFSITRSQRIL